MSNINDIAKLAGVAKSTVSRYLNGGSVSEKTRLKIDAVVKETGYQPNQFAQSLKRKRTNMIGVVIPRLNSYASNETLIGIESVMREINYQILIANTNLDTKREIEALKTFETSKIDGIILLATIITPELLACIKKIKVPVMIVGQNHPNLYTVIQNDYEAAKMLGAYFKTHQKDNLAYIGVSETDEAVGVNRKRGVIDGYEYPLDIYETTFSLNDAYQLGLKVLSEKDYNGIICATDNIALGILKAAHELKINVPKTLSIAGFGGYETTSIVSPQVTTMKYDYIVTGEVAARALLKRINDEEIPQIHVMPFTLEEKESVDIIRDAT